MKFEQTDSFEGGDHTRYTSFIYIDHPSARGNFIYVGAEGGQIYYYVISKTVLVNKQEELNHSSNTGNHSSAVVCLLHSKHRDLYSSLTGTTVDDGGFVFSGSSDRTIKVWRANGSFKPLIQTLHGHTSQVTALCDGCDGSVLSCSVDGSVRVWTPQQGRNLMMNPFFECKYAFPSPSSRKNDWMTAISVNPNNSWCCYVSNSEGDVSVYHKQSSTVFSRSEDLSETFSGGGGPGGPSGVAGGRTLFGGGVSGGPLGGVSRPQSAFGDTAPVLSLKCVWEKVHQLGISRLFVEIETNLLITLSFDCQCKILDASTGYPLFILQNTHHCMYTGVTWSKAGNYYLCDELGYLEVFSSMKEKTVACLHLLQTGSERRTERILGGHRDPVFRGICMYKGKDKEADLIGLPQTRILCLVPGSSNNTSSSAKANSAGSSSGSGGNGFSGVSTHSTVAAWHLTEDHTCAEFIGHRGAVLSLAVIPPPPAPHTAFAVPRLSVRRISFLNTQRRNSKGPPNISSIASLVSSLVIGRAPGSSIMLPGQADSPLLSTQTMSLEEGMYFSVGTSDRTVRCWDERDRQETYQFLVPGKAEITSMCMVWSLNLLAVGQEDGALCVMNSDSGSKITSSALRDTLTCLVEGHTAPGGEGAKMLLGADLSGRIAVWNLSLYKVRPSQITTDSLFMGYHDPEDPGIKCMAIHHPSNTCFSGGADGTIRYWRMTGSSSPLDSNIKTIDLHTRNSNGHDKDSEGDAGQICSLHCSDDFLLARTENGELRLWLIVTRSRGPEGAYQGTKPSSVNIVEVRMIVKWTSPFHQTLNKGYPSPAENLGSSRAVAALYQSDSGAVFVAQSRSNRSTTVWQVVVDPVSGPEAERKETSQYIIMGSREHRGKNREEGQGRAQEQGGEKKEGNGKGGERKEGQEQDEGGDDEGGEGEEEEDNVLVEVSSAEVVKHPNNEVSCMHLAAVGRADGPPESLHLGTAEGLILRFTLSITGAKIVMASKIKLRALANQSRLRRLTVKVTADKADKSLTARSNTHTTAANRASNTANNALSARGPRTVPERRRGALALPAFNKPAVALPLVLGVPKVAS